MLQLRLKLVNPSMTQVLAEHSALLYVSEAWRGIPGTGHGLG